MKNHNVLKSNFFMNKMAINIKLDSEPVKSKKKKMFKIVQVYKCFEKHIF